MFPEITQIFADSPFKKYIYPYRAVEYIKFFSTHYFLIFLKLLDILSFVLRI
ncbi:hypothetical protein CCAND95_820001 [Capnocytophaga canis]|uniref:Uncharacterized protein n=1 Tax=Capnocytophaga canis TaxID=1848903 RepID=A0A0B7I5Q6_9FLAO|nr:hypothetical protein CCAND38_130025 [Capnocytophaga canis]CEN47025.1 hypothetical protein CCAND95_820001 [Capnocytophaga canis]